MKGGMARITYFLVPILIDQKKSIARKDRNYLVTPMVWTPKDCRILIWSAIGLRPKSRLKLSICHIYKCTGYTKTFIDKVVKLNLTIHK
jgi:hypothetical protein